jgi:glycosyltransferase involved in cell wall biosynthesis
LIEVLYTAAHGGFSAEAAPLGGGAAVCDHLLEEWSRTRPFPFRLIAPQGVQGKAIAQFGEREYARFSREFERTSTEEILRHDPKRTVVLANDVSEGPDFRELAARGFRVFTIYHVDVVAYVAAIYLRGVLRPETTVRWARRLRPLLPTMAQLVWEKQESSVRWSRGLIVPSEGMREVLRRCYPEHSPAEKTHIVPWGAWDQDQATGDPEALRREYGVPRDARVLLTLSRISPEKGQDLLLEALAKWDPPLWLFICGDAAFMQGRRFLEKLKALATRLKHTRVIFPGHVKGARKRAFFALADVYVFPSRHESYGLTLLEALAAGLPAICLEHHGSRSVMREEFGEVVPEAGLRGAIERMLSDEVRRRAMGAAAREFASQQRFSASAARVAEILRQ